MKRIILSLCLLASTAQLALGASSVKHDKVQSMSRFEAIKSTLGKHKKLAIACAAAGISIAVLAAAIAFGVVRAEHLESVKSVLSDCGTVIKFQLVGLFTSAMIKLGFQQPVVPVKTDATPAPTDLIPAPTDVMPAPVDVMPAPALEVPVIA